MKDQQSFKLIDGIFSAAESREILQNVFSGKIQFHKIKNFSSQERFGKDDETALIRIPQLLESLKEIQGIIKAAQLEGKQIEIKSEVLIRTFSQAKDV